MAPRKHARRSRRRGLEVIRHPENQGVGAAIATGYARALALGADVTAVMAGDSQMDPADLAGLLATVVEGQADYAKGNRFQWPGGWRTMPLSRLCGNLALSYMTRLASGYRELFDSQCGYTAANRLAVATIVRGRCSRATATRTTCWCGWPARSCACATCRCGRCTDRTGVRASGSTA